MHFPPKPTYPPPSGLSYKLSQEEKSVYDAFVSAINSGLANHSFDDAGELLIACQAFSCFMNAVEIRKKIG